MHIDKDNKHAKFWLSPVSLAKSRNFRSHELSEIKHLIVENLDEIRRKWYGHFGREN